MKQNEVFTHVVLHTVYRKYAGGFTSETAAPEVLAAWVLEKYQYLNQRTMSGAATATGAVDGVEVMVAGEVPGNWHNVMEADMWSVGIILLQLLGASLPYTFSNYGDEAVVLREYTTAVGLYSDPEVIICPQYPHGRPLHRTTHPHILVTYQHHPPM